MPSTEQTPPRVVVELSQAQVRGVLRAARSAGEVPILMSGLMDSGEVREAGRARLRDRRLSSSLIAGLLVLGCFPADGGDLGNSEVAEMMDMSLSTTHRYVSTLLALGLLERDPGTRRYRLARDPPAA
jgi:IclR helix-turn-helix domain